MKKLYILWTAFVLLSLMLSGCQLPEPSASGNNGPDPQSVFTAAAQTAEVMRYERAASTLAYQAEVQTQTALAPTPTEELTPTPTGPVIANILIPTTGAPAPTDDKAEFVQDVTVPDGTTFAPGEAFIKTWRLKNIGTSTWTTAYSLVFVSGSLMGAPAAVSLPKEVPPGEFVDVSVNFIAPAEGGIYQSQWKLRNASDQVFGVGITATDAVWVTIGVAGLPAATTPTGMVGQIVTAFNLAVNFPQAVGTCPYTFMFTAQFTLSAPATVTYSIELGSDAGFEILLPSPTTRNLEAGAHTAVYELIFSNSLKGWARLHITAPEDLLSNQVNFELTCR